MVLDITISILTTINRINYLYCQYCSKTALELAASSKVSFAKFDLFLELKICIFF